MIAARGLVRAKLVIADLSFGNPNVFYELALRHATRKAVVQIIRTSDRLPFDVSQFRTVTIDMTDIYTLVPQLDLYRQEITRQCRVALEEGSTAENPLSLFYPRFWAEIAKDLQWRRSRKGEVEPRSWRGSPRWGRAGSASV